MCYSRFFFLMVRLPTRSKHTYTLFPYTTHFRSVPQLARLSGAPLMPENLAGRPFVVNLWATWCPPCRRELPMLADVAANSDIPILLANQGENRQAVADYLLAGGISPRSVVLDTHMTPQNGKPMFWARLW